MTDRDLKVIIGGLLHDIGKIIYRDGSDTRTHSISGYDFLKEEIGISDKDILECVKYHHAHALKNANIDEDSLAYAVYIADNIASAIDRRQKNDEERGFELHTPLQPVFNILNHNKDNKYYSTNLYNVENDINYPIDDKMTFSKEQYHEIVLNITDNLKSIDLNNEYVNSLLEVLEANLSYVPSSTSKAELPDISLFDHLKITAAISSAIVRFLDENEHTSYADVLFKEEQKFYEKDVFLLATIDLSGIQDFIYTIQSKNALRTLRARSFYLEIMMEHIIDELLVEIGLSRCNLLYVGGGHCYLLLPNTPTVRECFNTYIEKLNSWLFDTFQISLYAAAGYTPCSANALKNEPKGSYQEIFSNLSGIISAGKLNRYSADEIIKLNKNKASDYSRECAVCKSLAKLNSDNLCPICAAIQRFSGNVLYSDFFTVEYGEDENSLRLPGGFFLTDETEDSLKNKMENDEKFVRAYCKNRSYTGKHIATKLWVGNHSAKSTFEEFAKTSKGINRIAILRADVDNLGQAFVAGFKNEANDDRYVTISRTATLSRQLSLFFKLHINKLLKHPQFSLDGSTDNERNITVVYSGGDDIFVVGAWNEVIEFGIDLRNSFRKFAQGTLTISAGIGLYDSSYPVSASAFEVEQMVERSKALPNKNGITLLEDGCFHVDESGNKISDGTYEWSELIDEVIGAKLMLISKYMHFVETEHGNALLYKILELVRGQDEKINFARFIYTLSRLEPETGATDEQREAFKEFSANMIKWIKTDRDKRHLKTAIELYVYLHRGEESDEDNK